MLQRKKNRITQITTELHQKIERKQEKNFFHKKNNNKVKKEETK